MSHDPESAPVLLRNHIWGDVLAQFVPAMFSAPLKSPPFWDRVVGSHAVIKAPLNIRICPPHLFRDVGAPIICF